VIGDRVMTVWAEQFLLAAKKKPAPDRLRVPG
jgi:hypothetical protein